MQVQQEQETLYLTPNHTAMPANLKIQFWTASRHPQIQPTHQTNATCIPTNHEHTKMCNNMQSPKTWKGREIGIRNRSTSPFFVSALCLHCGHKFAGVNEPHTTTGTPSLSQHTPTYPLPLPLALHYFMQNSPCRHNFWPFMFHSTCCSLFQIPLQ